MRGGLAVELEPLVVRIEVALLLVGVLVSQHIVTLTQDGLDRVLVRLLQIIIFDVVRGWVLRHHHEVEIERRREVDAEGLKTVEPSLVINDDSIVGIPFRDVVDLLLLQVVAVYVCVLQQLLGGVLDASPPALMAGDIQVQQRDMRYAKAV